MNEVQAKELTERLNLLKVYEQALKEIEKFGHSHGHGHGYTCANIAAKALKNSPIVEEYGYNDYPPDLVKSIFDELDQ
jgi:hypothetical protein